MEMMLLKPLATQLATEHGAFAREYKKVLTTYREHERKFFELICRDINYCLFVNNRFH
jgi:hypothetical protein